MIIRALLSLFLALAMPAMPGAPQQVDMGATAEKLAGKAIRKTEINLDQSMLNLAAAFLSDNDADQAAAKRIIAGLKGVFVRVYEFASADDYSQADLDPLRRQLTSSGWSQIVNSVGGDETAGVWLRQENGAASGLAVIVTEHDEVTLVNLVGTIKPEDLAALGGQFGIPKIDTK
jgi:hypothetical protein